MTFNSVIFIVFFVAVYSLYCLLQHKHKAQNILLLIASYIFYGWWDWRFTLLLLLTTTIDFNLGKRLGAVEDPRKRKLFVTYSVIINLTILGFFKYFNFFSEGFENVLNILGMKADLITLKVILPVGISFYTFQSIAYIIDIYRRKLEPSDDFLDFATFVAFFPQLVAGPIERAGNLLKRITTPRQFDIAQINAGVFLILWGYFKKVVISDHMAFLANRIFNHYTEYSGADYLVGVLAFTFQIYGDFSGYTDIARGVSKLFGFDLMVNFKLPYFAVSPSDFWSRWHVSLSSWLRDYLYIPLGGNRNGVGNTYRNLMLTMLLGGLWHGASWNFVIWGAYQGTILVAYRLWEQIRGERSVAGTPSKLSLFTQMAFMFVLTMAGWFFFRVTSVEQMMYMMRNVSFSVSPQTWHYLFLIFFFTMPLIIMQVFQHRSGNLLCVLNLRSYYRIPIYSVLLIMIIVYGSRENVEFIYFQF